MDGLSKAFLKMLFEISHSVGRMPFRVKQDGQVMDRDDRGARAREWDEIRLMIKVVPVLSAGRAKSMGSPGFPPMPKLPEEQAPLPG
jgi:hypothetical protein